MYARDTRTLIVNILAITPLLYLTLYYMVVETSQPLIVFLSITLLLLGIWYNRYTLVVAVVLIATATLYNISLGPLCLSSWLLGIIVSPKTSIVDLVLAYVVAISSIDYVLGLNYVEVALALPVIVLILSKTNLHVDKIIEVVSFSTIIVALVIALSKTTTTYPALNMYAASTITIILLAEKIARLSRK